MGPWFGVEVALAAALEHIPSASFVVSGTGKVVQSNRLGATWLTVGENRDLLARRGGPDRERFVVTPFRFGATTHYLAILRQPETPPPQGFERWKLTRRETEVLSAIVRGATNQQIAGELGCALKTIEHHVSNILRKVNVENRASLIVAVLEP